MSVIFVTGSNQGIGYALLERLGKHSADYKLIMGARSEEKAKKAIDKLAESGIKVDFVQFDATSDESIANAAKAIDAKYGKLDILINNAAIAYPDSGGQTTGTIRGDMLANYNTNVAGIVVVHNEFRPLLLKSDIKKVINFSSGLGSNKQLHDLSYGPMPLELVPYTATKPALNAVTLLYSHWWQKDGIKLILVDPGYCSTNLNSFHGHKSAHDGAESAFEAVTKDYWKSGEFVRKEPTDEKLVTVPW